jgi:hypothetical protein
VKIVSDLDLEDNSIMSTEAIDLFNAALALPEAARIEIAHGLLASVTPPDVLRADTPNVAEQIAERIAEYDRGEVQLVEFEDAMQRVRAALAASRKS